MKIKISADSTCDLPQELIEKYDIGIVPLYVVKDGVAFKDGREITPRDIYDHVAAGGELCSTAAVSVSDYMEYFSERLKECDEIVHLHISSHMSACYQNACLAARELGHVYPVDSYNLSSAIALLVMAGVDMIREGNMSGQEIQAALTGLREKLDASFLVDTLAYLRKGGRCSAVAALGANLLSLKPCIEVHDGKMSVAKKYRGTIKKCLLQYVRDRLEGRDDIDTKRIFITDSHGFTDADREEIKAEVLRCQSFEEAHFVRAGGTISCHCGPGTLGILYMHK